MARVKIKVERGNGLQQVVVVDTEATKGATIGRDVFNADGTLYAPASGGSGANIRNGYGILVSGTSPKTINVNRAADFAWQGQHSWEKPLWAPDGAAAAPGVAFGPDHEDGLYRVGTNNIGITTDGALRWDVNNSRVNQAIDLRMRLPADPTSDVKGYLFTSAADYAGVVNGDPPVVFRYVGTAGSTDTKGFEWVFGAPNSGSDIYGFLWRWRDLSADTGDLTLYRYGGGTTLNHVLGFSYADSQVRFALGSNGAPSMSFLGDLNTGVYSPTADTVGITAGGTLRFSVSTAAVTSTLPFRGPAGSQAAPAYSFSGDAASGMYSGGIGFFTFSANNTNVITFSTTRVGPFLPIRGDYAGTAAAPAYSTNANSADTNTGFFFPAADTVSVATGGSERFRYGPAGQLGIGGATYGTANTQAIVSGGASAAPSWQTVLVDGQTQTLGGAKTWSGAQFFTGNYTTNYAGYTGISLGQLSLAAVGQLYTNSAAGADAKVWGFEALVGDSSFNIRALNDAFSDERYALRIFRSGYAISAFQYGNSTDNPAHTFYGALHYASGLQNFADDAAAAAGGIAVNQLYRNGSVVMIRVS